MVSIMPCTAKKAEAIRPNSFTKGEQDTDIVITTTELIRMINNFGLDFAALEPEACDMPFGFGSGGGVIFGVTGGVTEAVLRRLSPEHTKEAMREISECGVRGDEGIKEFSVPYKGMEIKVCVTSGLANARTVMERVKKRRGGISSDRGYGLQTRLYYGRWPAYKSRRQNKGSQSKGTLQCRQYHDH